MTPGLGPCWSNGRCPDSDTGGPSWSPCKATVGFFFLRTTSLVPAAGMTWSQPGWTGGLYELGLPPLARVLLPSPRTFA
jgi:hypothetical protein